MKFQCIVAHRFGGTLDSFTHRGFAPLGFLDSHLGELSFFTVDSYLKFYSTSQWLQGNWSCDKNLQPDWCAASRTRLKTSVNASTRPFPPRAEVGWPTRLIFNVERYVGWGCILNCFMLLSVPCFNAFCWSAKKNLMQDNKVSIWVHWIANKC